MMFSQNNNFASYSQSVPSLDLTDLAFIGNNSQENYQHHSEDYGSFNNIQEDKYKSYFTKSVESNQFSMNSQQTQAHDNLIAAFNDENKQSTSVYTAFEDLPNYGENVNLDYIVDQMKVLFEDKSNWKSKFDAIDSLRILNKYHADKVNEIIDLFWSCIVESFESQKTNLVKNILMFSAEAFMNAKEVRLQDEVIMVLVPQVLNKSNSERSMVKKEAETALCNLISNCCYDSSVIILCQSCFDKNASICEIALDTLAAIIDNIGDDLPMLRPESLRVLMLTLAKTMDSAKKGNMKNLATGLCKAIDQRFGRENYQELVINFVANEDMDLAQYLAKAVEEKKEKESNFNQFLQEKRRVLRLNNLDNGSNWDKINNDVDVVGKQRTVLGEIEQGNNQGEEQGMYMGYGMGFPNN